MIDEMTIFFFFNAMILIFLFLFFFDTQTRFKEIEFKQAVTNMNLQGVKTKIDTEIHHRIERENIDKSRSRSKSIG